MRDCIKGGTLIIFLLPFLGCEKRATESLPPDEVLISLIYDLHLAEASMTRVHVSVQDSIALILRERVATSYGITPDKMESWLEILQKSPDHLNVVYDSVIARFERTTRK
jgi:nucleotidyltransferase/DNA polymerase involved in DNA repair